MWRISSGREWTCAMLAACVRMSDCGVLGVDRNVEVWPLSSEARVNMDPAHQMKVRMKYVICNVEAAPATSVSQLIGRCKPPLHR